MTKFIISILILSAIVSCQSPGLKTVTQEPVTKTIVTEESGWLGITLSAKGLPPQKAGKELPDNTGAQLVIDDLYWDSPAQRTGLKHGDILIELAGQPVHSVNEALSLIKSSKADEIVKIKILRPTQDITLTSGDKKENLTPDKFLSLYQKVLLDSKPGTPIKIEASHQNVPLDFFIKLTKTPQPLRKEGLSPNEKIMPLTKKAWIGIRMDDINDLSPFGKPPDIKGVKITEVVKDAPAEKSGLQTNDIIIAYDDKNFPCLPIPARRLAGGDIGTEPKTEIAETPNVTLRQYIKEHRAGDVITLTILREDHKISATLNSRIIQIPPKKIPEEVTGLKTGSTLQIGVVKNYQTLNIPVTLGSQHVVLQADQTAVDWTNDSFHPELINYTMPLEQTLRQVISSTNIADKYDDLIKRFTDDEKWEDAFRLKEIKYLHRDPFKIEKVSSDLINDLRRTGSAPAPDFPGLLTALAGKIDALDPRRGMTSELITINSLKSGLPLEEHITQIEQILEQTAVLRQQALAGLTISDLEFLSANIYDFADQEERAALKPETEKKVLELASCVNYEKLVQSAQTLAVLLNPGYLEGLRRDLESSPDKPVIFSKDTPWGKIIIGGRGDQRYTEPAALIVDLDGNDFYGNQTGVSSLYQPISLIIDFSGNDRYSSSVHGGQACGLLGVSFLADLSGADDYLGQQWAQGTGLIGVGLLYEQSGDDIYRGEAYNQGAGLFGLGLLLDLSGADYYTSEMYAQGFGSSKGAGLLLDDSGNDTYYATGQVPGYPDNPGTFTGMSQGTGYGVRKGELSRSGGLGILIDNNGRDYYEAGTFSQGGGYYFAWGILADGGDDNDTYFGTRYAQGFSAHSALGFFIDEGGDDHYSSHIGVHAGLAWDLCSTVFIDKKGNDTYAPNGGFSIGAVAHNSFTLFYDAEGNDNYLCPLGKASAGNTYHGGYSLGVFLDEDSAEDNHIDKVTSDTPHISFYTKRKENPDDQQIHFDEIPSGVIEVAPPYSIVFNLNKKISELSIEETQNILIDLTKEKK